MRRATCPACRGTGVVVGYTRGEAPAAVYLCLKCSGRFTVPLARAQGAV